MGRFLLARARHAAIVIVLVTALVFVLGRLAPGDPFLAVDDPQASVADRARLREQWGYDLPAWRQYGRWMGNFALGDFGWSHSRAQPVASVLRETVPNTLLLTIPAALAGIIAGVLLGTWQAARRERVVARASDTAALVMISVPDFIVALGALTLFALRWRVAPLSGMVDTVDHDAMSAAGRAADVLTHLALPCATLAVLTCATVSRYHAAAMRAVLGAEYVRAARAEGVGGRRRLWRHAMRNALAPVITVSGLLLPTLAGGAVFVEQVFGWPGMGRTLVDAVLGRDYALVQALAVIGTVLVTAGGALADVLAAAANPRLAIDP